MKTLICSILFLYCISLALCRFDTDPGTVFQIGSSEDEFIGALEIEPIFGRIFMGVSTYGSLTEPGIHSGKVGADSDIAFFSLSLSSPLFTFSIEDSYQFGSAGSDDVGYSFPSLTEPGTIYVGGSTSADLFGLGNSPNNAESWLIKLDSVESVNGVNITANSSPIFITNSTSSYSSTSRFCSSGLERPSSIIHLLGRDNSENDAGLLLTLAQPDSQSINLLDESIPTFASQVWEPTTSNTFGLTDSNVWYTFNNETDGSAIVVSLEVGESVVTSKLENSNAPTIITDALSIGNEGYVTGVINGTDGFVAIYDLTNLASGAGSTETWGGTTSKPASITLSLDDEIVVCAIADNGIDIRVIESGVLGTVQTISIPFTSPLGSSDVRDIRCRVEGNSGRLIVAASITGQLTGQSTSPTGGYDIVVFSLARDSITNDDIDDTTNNDDNDDDVGNEPSALLVPVLIVGGVLVIIAIFYIVVIRVPRGYDERSVMGSNKFIMSDDLSDFSSSTSNVPVDPNKPKAFGVIKYDPEANPSDLP